VKTIFISVSELKEKLHQYIENSDELLLTEMYKMISDEDAPYNYSVDDIEAFYKRRQDFLNGKGKNYTISDSINSIKR